MEVCTVARVSRFAFELVSVCDKRFNLRNGLSETNGIFYNIKTIEGFYLKRGLPNICFEVPIQEWTLTLVRDSALRVNFHTR